MSSHLFIFIGKVNWLVSEKTLREQGVSETTVVTLRKRFFVSDLNLDQGDSVKLNVAYTQVCEIICALCLIIMR